ncbi:beta-glucosidase [Aquipuribacter hungaricus]|uniref:Glycoside hydrolase family 3 protein n=1 Tax=Aquipuribacter hungaricus TaxID=545624 RepID=A0ABV7WLD5_9MICO
MSDELRVPTLDPGVPADDPSVDELVDRLSLAQQVRVLTGADFWALHAEPAVGLRRLVTSDGPAGVRGERWDERDPSANLPSPTSLAATWDPARVERLGRLLAAEARSKGVDVLLAPTINLHRTPFGGRHFECLSEDPFLTAEIATAYVRGVQSQGVAATVKHFVANDSETDRFLYDAQVDERTLHELYLAPFERVVADADPWAVMAAYNGVGGTTMTESPLLQELLKDAWGFDGVVMTDWFAGRSTEAAALSGLDLLMPGPSGPWGDRLVAAVEEGRVPAAAVREKVRRLLLLALRVGALEGSYPRVPEPWPADRVAGELRSAAAAGFVLAANDGILPLEREQLTRLALVGPDAVSGRTLGGGSATVFPPYTVGPLEGLRRVLGEDVEVTWSQGVSSTDRVAALDPSWLQQGAVVRFLDASGEELARETRHSTSLMWLGELTGTLRVPDVDTIELTAVVQVPSSGTYLLGVAGVGPFELALDDAAVLTATVALPEGADPVEGMMRPPQQTVPVDLEAGRPVRLRLRHRPAPTGGFGDAEVATVTFRLLLALSPSADDDLLDAAAEAAAAADVAVVVVGTTAEVESEGFDRTTLALPGRQDELVRRVLAANPRTVVVVNSGAPVLLPWADEAPAVLLTWFPGQEFGNALSDVLLGMREPGGRLPVTWPRSEEGLPSTTPVDGVLAYEEGLRTGYRWYDSEGREPLYGFGHGLGYTTWELGDASSTGTPASGLTITVPVTCRGARPGRQVVQVYASRVQSTVERVPRWLVGSVVVDAAPGESVTATVHVPRRALEHWDVAAHAWALEQGVFRLHVGTSLADVVSTVEVWAA